MRGEKNLSDWYGLPLPPRLVRDLLQRREKILEHAARAEVDLSVGQLARFYKLADPTDKVQILDLTVIFDDLRA